AVPPAEPAARLDPALVGLEAVERARRGRIRAPAGRVRVAAEGVADEEDVVLLRRERPVRLVRDSHVRQHAAGFELEPALQLVVAGLDDADRAWLPSGGGGGRTGVGEALHFRKLYLPGAGSSGASPFSPLSTGFSPARHGFCSQVEVDCAEA